MMVCDVVRPQF